MHSDLTGIGIDALEADIQIVAVGKKQNAGSKRSYLARARALLDKIGNDSRLAPRRFVQAAINLRRMIGPG